MAVDKAPQAAITLKSRHARKELNTGQTSKNVDNLPRMLAVAKSSIRALPAMNRTSLSSSALLYERMLASLDIVVDEVELE